MNDDEILKLQNIFYVEAPHNYVMEFVPRKMRGVLGECVYDDQVCYIYGHEDYEEALITLLHEIAHARMVIKGHTNTWEMEFIRLLQKYRVPKDVVRNHHAERMGTNMKEWLS